MIDPRQIGATIVDVDALAAFAAKLPKPRKLEAPAAPAAVLEAPSSALVVGRAGW